MPLLLLYGEENESSAQSCIPIFWVSVSVSVSVLVSFSVLIPYPLRILHDFVYGRNTNLEITGNLANTGTLRPHVLDVLCSFD
jgi:hypothetical protein